MQQQPRRWPGFDICVETKLRLDVYIYVLGHRDGRFCGAYIRPVAVNGLNYHGFDRSAQNASGRGGTESTTRESLFAREIRPLAVVITSESRAQYTALYENHMN